jgi:hypothetical protein
MSLRANPLSLRGADPGSPASMQKKLTALVRWGSTPPLAAKPAIFFEGAKRKIIFTFYGFYS